MNESIITIVEKIAEDIMNMIQAIFESEVAINMKVGLNTLADSRLREELYKEFNLKGDNILIQYFFNDYIKYIESGRRKGAKMPPISALREWAGKRGIPTDNKTLYSIAMAIKRDGIAPRPFLATLDINVEEYIGNNDFGDLFESIITTITDYFSENK